MIKKIAFKKECSPDFFSFAPLPQGYIGYFVSLLLKNQIEEAGCTGVIFVAVDEAILE